jgi:uncharacterized protein YyaL (SSP411 family)
MKRGPVFVYQYGLLDVMRASPTQPLPVEARTRQLTRMYEGLRALETAPQPTPDDWRVCSDAVNLIETLVGMGVVEDASGLLLDAVTALAMAGKRHKAGHALRLDAPGIKAVRSVLEDYAAVIAQLPARTVIQAHRATEKRIHDILRGRNKPHDVTISSL